MGENQATYLQGRITELQNQKRIKMAEISEIDRQMNLLLEMVKGRAPIPHESCGMPVGFKHEELYPVGC